MQKGALRAPQGEVTGRLTAQGKSGEATGHKKKCCATEKKVQRDKRAGVRPATGQKGAARLKKIAGDRPAWTGQSETGSTGPPRRFNRF
jgi:hypothetical protein